MTRPLLVIDNRENADLLNEVRLFPFTGDGRRGAWYQVDRLAIYRIEVFPRTSLPRCGRT